LLPTVKTVTIVKKKQKQPIVPTLSPGLSSIKKKSVINSP